MKANQKHVSELNPVVDRPLYSQEYVDKMRQEIHDLKIENRRLHDELAVMYTIATERKPR